MFVRIGLAGDLPEGRLAAHEVAGRRVAVANVGGTFHAFDDDCTHRRCSLAMGELRGSTVICSCHGSEFDIATGVVLRGPATQPVAVHRVRREEDGTLAVDVGQALG